MLIPKCLGLPMHNVDFLVYETWRHELGQEGFPSRQGDHRLQEQAWNLRLILRHAQVLLPKVYRLELHREGCRRKCGK